MKKQKIDLTCISCDNSFIIDFKSKDPLSYCPFCGDDIDGLLKDGPLLNDLDSLDAFDEEDLIFQENDFDED